MADNPREISVRWSPGHTGVQGNERADELANFEAHEPHGPMGMADQPTASGIGTLARSLARSHRKQWWERSSEKLTHWYRQWEAPYTYAKGPKTLQLPRQVLARLLAIRTKHGDFAWYHKKFHHDDANLQCTCGRDKTPDHLLRCTKMRRLFHRWPNRPSFPPCDNREVFNYLEELFDNPQGFKKLLRISNFYADICKR